MRRSAAVIVLVTCLAGIAHAQAPTPANAMTIPHGCTYDTCALRLSSRVIGGMRVQRGLDGPWQRFGFAGGGVVRAVQSVPAAFAAADSGHRMFKAGAITSIIGGLASAVMFSAAARNDISGSSRNTFIAGGFAGGLVSVFGGIQLTRGNERFSRAIWLFNREIPR